MAESIPEGVQFRRLGEIGELVRGNGLPKTDFTDSGVGAIHYGQIYTRYGTWATKTFSFVAPETARRLAKVDPGDVIITNTSENVEDVGKAVAWLGGDQIVTGGHATVLKHDQDPKYIAYWLQSPSFRRQKAKLATGTKVIDVSAKQLATVKIPVPPLTVQREIVKVLDRFAHLTADLEADLEAELEARRSQYGHYRSALFDAPSVKRVPLGEAGDFIRGRRFTKNDVVDEGIPSIHYGEIYTRYGIAADEAFSHVRLDLKPRLRFARPGDVVIAAVGETVEDVGRSVAWLGGSEVAIHDDCFLYRSEVLNPKFVSHFMRTTRLNREKAQYVARAKVKRLSSRDLAKLEIPVPPIEEQSRIVATLDKFNGVINDISVSLPVEIAARRKQFEYHRDRLLTFEELAA